MHIYILYAHPSKTSFTHEVLEAFTRGLREAGHTYEIGDLYEMGFQTDMDLEQYKRESSQTLNTPVPEDVRTEQEKIARADALAFIYPLWWSDCPAKLKGWFDRVWTYGYAYLYDEHGEHVASKITIEKALVMCTAGHTIAELEESGIAESMRRIMLNDRLLGVWIKQASLVILGGMVDRTGPARTENLERSYRLGLSF